MGCWSWLKTALIPTSEASISRVKGFENSSKAKIDACVIEYLSLEKVVLASGTQGNLSCFSKYVKAVAITA